MSFDSKFPSTLPNSAQRTPGRADTIFNAVDDRNTADFPDSLENTFWILQGRNLYCGGNLKASPEFKMSGFDWTGKNRGLNPRYLQATSYYLHTSHKQACKLQNLCISMASDSHVGYFIKFNFNGTRVMNIGVVVEDCFLKGIDVSHINNSVDPLVLCQTQFYHSFGGSAIYYVDDSIYDDPDPLIQHFIQFNALHINCRRSCSSKIAVQPLSLEHKL